MQILNKHTNKRELCENKYQQCLAGYYKMKQNTSELHVYSNSVSPGDDGTGMLVNVLTSLALCQELESRSLSSLTA